MSLNGMLSQTATIVKPGQTTDRYQNAAPDWSAPTTTTVSCRLEQMATIELTVGRDTVTADWRLFLLPAIAIAPYDRVQVGGRTFEVVGVPAVLVTPRGPHHLEVSLRSVDG